MRPIMTSRTGADYRQDIDGMRAIAVLGVMLFHLGQGFLPGGFVGVDIFFVLSGFLITKNIYTQLQAKEFSFGEFYHRRIARIFPPMVLLLVSVQLASYFVFPWEDIASIGAASTASAAALANLKFMLQGDYFQIVPDTQPLLHIWSLSMEEQFYFLLPFVLWILCMLGCSSLTIYRLFIVLFGSSLLFGIVLTFTNRTYAFYFMPGRAWEFLAGSIVAIVASNRTFVPNEMQAYTLRLLGLTGVVASLLLIRESNGFPGAIAMIPVASSCLVILAGGEYSKGALYKILASNWMTYIGRRSYSLYLWHWPIYCIVDYKYFYWTVAVRVLVKIAFTIALAFAAYAIVELPLRIYINKCLSRSMTIVSFLSVSALIAAFGYYMHQTNYYDASVASLQNGGITINPHLSGPVVVLYGDSIGSTYGRALRDLAMQEQFRLHIASIAGSRPLPPSAHYRESLELFANVEPDVIIVAIAWTNYRKQPNEVVDFVCELSHHARHVLVLGQPPLLPPGSSRADFQQSGVKSCSEDPKWVECRRVFEEKFKELPCKNVRYVDIARLLECPNGDVRFVDDEGNQMYQDYLHLSGFGSKYIFGEISDDLISVLRSPKDAAKVK